MKKVVRKLFFVWNYEKEEMWLNAMSAQGWQLKSVGFARYEFESGEPREFQYRMEFLKWMPKTEQARDYLAFVEDTGAEVVDTYFQWAYYRKPVTAGEFEIFSDKASLIEHYKRLLFIFVPLMLLNIPIQWLSGELVSSGADYLVFVRWTDYVNLAVFLLLAVGVGTLCRRIRAIRR
ncbi:MAG: DUF2812 domain-containing protein [Turicibacter sp.]|nr:DUF2812 domain-containing protein [Turicibacter sp.]